MHSCTAHHSFMIKNSGRQPELSDDVVTCTGPRQASVLRWNSCSVQALTIGDEVFCVVWPNGLDVGKGHNCFKERHSSGSF